MVFRKNNAQFFKKATEIMHQDSSYFNIRGISINFNKFH